MANVLFFDSSATLHSGSTPSVAFLLEVLSEDGRLLDTEHGIRPGTAYDIRIVGARVLSFRSAVSAQLHCTIANIF